MAERTILAEDFYEFATSKHGSLCRVKQCRNDRMLDRRVCPKHNMQLWRARNPTVSAYNNLRSSARKRGLKFTITLEQFKELVLATGYIENRGNHGHQLHIDRDDAGKGYEPGNLVVMTCSENSRKGAYERWVTLPSGHRVRLYELGVGVERALPVNDPEALPDWLCDDLDFEDEAEDSVTDQPF